MKVVWIARLFIDELFSSRRISYMGPIDAFVVKLTARGARLQYRLPSVPIVRVGRGPGSSVGRAVD